MVRSQKSNAGLRPTRWAPSLLKPLTFCCAGTLVALDVNLRASAIGAFALMAGLLHRYVNCATLAPGGAGVLMLGRLARA